MIGKVIKYGIVSVVVLAVVGGGLFGTDLFSYVRTSARSIRTSVKDSVPLEFELQRARDMLVEIVPEIHANIRLIAQEEVEVERLKDDIARCETALVDSEARVRKLGGLLATDEVYYTISNRQYSRSAVKTDLARRFERHKEAEIVLLAKRRMLQTRENSLIAAIQMLEKARGEKALLADKIESLTAQHRLVQAAAVGSKFQVENSKLAQTQKLIDEIKGRLDVAERVLAHEGRFVEQMEIDVVDEQDLLTQVHDHFDGAVASEMLAVEVDTDAIADAAID